MSLSSAATVLGTTVPKVQLQSFHWKVPRLLHLNSSPQFHRKHPPLLCSKLTPWQPLPLAHAPSDDDTDGSFLKECANIFESMNTEERAETAAPDPNTESNISKHPSIQPQPLKWPMWLLGPSLLLVTGMVPTLWLPLSSVFLGTNIASLLSLVGLDCIFNLGATLFLLMADTCARPKNLTKTTSFNSEAPKSYRFWNIVASLMGFGVPLAMLIASQKGLLQPQLSFISFGVLLGPYLLLLSIQMLTEMLTWHWRSPVWLMTPVVYEAYRVLQLTRGLRLSSEIGAPAWTVETIRVLVSWWVLILGVQLMRVAWFAGFTARAREQT